MGIQSPESVDLAGIWTEAVSGQRGVAEGAGIAVRIDARSAVVRGEASLLRALADNLVDNAIKHNHDNGFVEVSVRRSGEVATIDIENSGPVLDAATLERIAMPFQRYVDNPDNLGHGLGMTIIRTIVDRHTGSIDVRAREEGGLAITVRLPTAGTVGARSD